MPKLHVLFLLVPVCMLATDWQALNHPISGRVDDMSMGWNAELGVWVIYVANERDRLYRSTNEGELWLPMEDGVTFNPTCVVTHENNSQIVYVGREDVTPVWKSTDGGTSWNPASLGINNTHPICFEMDPNDVNTILLGCEADGGMPVIFKTTNGGVSWNPLATPVSDATVHDIAAFSGSSRLLVSCSVPPPQQTGGVFLSTDGGNAWALKMGWCSRSVEISKSDPHYVYATANNHDKIYRSEDRGDSWTLLGYAPMVWIFDIAIDPTTPATLFMGHDVGAISWSVNYGNNWSPRNSGIYPATDTISAIRITPDDVQKMYAGGPVSVYKSARQGDDWKECVEGMEIETGCALASKFPGVIYALSGEGTVHHSLDCCQSWTTLFKTSVGYDIVTKPDEPATLFVAVRSEAASHEIYKGQNYGQYWYSVYTLGFDPGFMKLSVDPLKSDTIYAACRNPDPLGQSIVRTTDNGDHWELLTVATPAPELHSIVCDPVNADVLYVGGAQGAIYRSTDAGSTWQQSNNGIPSAAVVIDFGVDPYHPETMYAGSTYDGIYKTTNSGTQWYAVNNGLGSSLPQLRALSVDPEEPSIVYVAGLHGMLFIGQAYLSVDGGNRWLNISNNLGQAFPNDLRIDPDFADTTFAATSKGVYIYEPGFFNKHLTSSSDTATAYNNGKKLIEVHATNEFWVTYESGGVVYAAHSTDRGQTWSRKMEVGKGCNPSIAIRDVPEYPPCIVWRTHSDEVELEKILFSRYLGGGNWSDAVTVAIPQAGAHFGPPSFIIDNGNNGHVVYAEISAQSSDIYHISFNVYSPSPNLPELVGSGIDPSIGFMSYGSGNPELHVSWQSGTRLYYRSKTGGTWNSPEFIYAGGSHSCLDVIGNVVHVVCEKNGDIWQRQAVYTTGGSHTWSTNRVSNTNDPSVCPVITDGNACAWTENASGNYETYYSFYDWGIGWSGPINVSNTTERSYCSHIAKKETVEGDTVYLIWTEKDVAPFDVMFARLPFSGYALQGIASEDLIGAFKYKGLYPNPAKEMIRIRFLSPDRRGVNIRLYDAMGRMVKSLFDGRSRIGLNEISSTTKNIANGVYFVRMATGNEIVTGKVVIRR